MDFIIENIAIGNYQEAQNISLLKENNIKAILCLDGCLRSKKNKDLGVKKIEVCPLIDGAGNDFRYFMRTIFTLEELLENYSKALVHCHAGRSRSVAIVAGYLVKFKKIEVEKALSQIAAIRETAIAPELIDLLYLL